MNDQVVYVSKPEYVDNLELAEGDPVERVWLAHQLAVMKGLDSIEEEHEFTLDCPACCFAAALLVPRGWLRRSLAEFGPDVEQLAELYVVPPRIIECRLLGESPAA